MIATAAETNPSCFSPTPLVDVHRTFIPTYLRVVSSGTASPSRSPNLSLHSRGTLVTTGRTLNSARSSFAETTLSLPERKRRSSRPGSQRLSVTTTWTTLREIGPKGRQTLKRFVESSMLALEEFHVQSQQPPSSLRT